MAAETTPGKPGLIHNKKVMIAVAVAVLAGVAYYLYRRNKNQATAATTPAVDNSTADPNASLGSAGLSPTSGDASGSGSSSGSDLAGIESLLATEQANNAALNAANGNLYGGVITSQEGLIADLAGSVQTVSQTALQQLGSVAGSAVSGLTSAATKEPSTAAAPAPAPAPGDGGGGAPAGGDGSGVFTPTTPAAGNPAPAAVQKAASSASGAAGVKAGTTKVNYQAKRQL